MSTNQITHLNKQLFIPLLYGKAVLHSIGQHVLFTQQYSVSGQSIDSNKQINMRIFCMLNTTQRNAILEHSPAVVKTKLLIADEICKPTINNIKANLPSTLQQNLFYIPALKTSETAVEFRNISKQVAKMSHHRWFKSMASIGMASLRLTYNDVLYLSLPLYHNNAIVAIEKKQLSF